MFAAALRGEEGEGEFALHAARRFQQIACGYGAPILVVARRSGRLKPLGSVRLLSYPSTRGGSEVSVRGGVMRKLYFAVLSMLAALCVAPEARSQTADDPFDALVAVQGFFRQSVWGCKFLTYNNANGVPKILAETLHVTGAAFSFDCHVSAQSSSSPSVNQSFHYRFTDYPAPRFVSNIEGYHLCMQQTGCAENLKILSQVRKQPDVQQKLLSAWSTLATPRRALEPASDPTMQNASAGDPESLRRTQVQVELALRQNNNLEGARLYRDTLRASPGWADGHYNLGLLYGDLELYPEAITEMRRYLFLTPTAQDARAVQDKIYEWEAAMGASGRAN
ncbi:MAG: hypothetical protein AB7M12_01320 [Hyphomonadaceae bacterium]